MVVLRSQTHGTKDPSSIVDHRGQGLLGPGLLCGVAAQDDCELQRGLCQGLEEGQRGELQRSEAVKSGLATWDRAAKITTWVSALTLLGRPGGSSGKLA